MKIKSLGLLALSFLISSQAFAASNIVAQVSAVEGNVKVESLQGKRSVALVVVALVLSILGLLLQAETAMPTASSR